MKEKSHEGRPAANQKGESSRDEMDETLTDVQLKDERTQQKTRENRQRRMRPLMLEETTER